MADSDTEKWTVYVTGTFPDTNHHYGISGGPTGRIALVEGWGAAAEMRARLIAASPELHAALAELVHLKDTLKHSDPAEYERRKEAAWDAARAAVAKTEGKGKQGS